MLRKQLIQPTLSPPTIVAIARERRRAFFPTGLGLLLSLLSAWLLSLSFAPFRMGFLAWVALIPWLWAVRRSSLFQSVAYSLVTLGLFWAGHFAWVVPTCRWGGVATPWAVTALAGLAFYCALFGVFQGLLARSFRKLPGWMRPLALATSWAALEWARGTLFTGFPWSFLAYTQWSFPPALSLAEWGGPYLTSFTLVLVNGWGLELVMWQGQPTPRKRDLLIPGAMMMALASAGIYLAQRPLSIQGPAFRVALVQGNIDQYKKWDRNFEQEILTTYEQLTRQAAENHPDLIVWPETAVPGWIPDDPRFTNWLQSLARQSGTFLLTGAATVEQGRSYNGAFLLGPDGVFEGVYLKQHLVPFGEYLPARSWLSRWVGPLNEMGEFSASSNVPVFRRTAVPWSVSICFEDLFPDLMARFTRRGAGFLINLTNDGWYRNTAAPEQHFVPNVFRAVESRSWVVRCANTGISGFIDPRGRVVSRGPLLAPAVLESAVAATGEATFYVRHGDLFAGLCALWTLLFWFRAVFFRHPRRR